MTNSRYTTGMIINAPVPFQGTNEEANANFATHQFYGVDDVYCIACSCKPWHASAHYPCGEEPPRYEQTI